MRRYLNSKEMSRMTIRDFKYGAYKRDEEGRVYEDIADPVQVDLGSGHVHHSAVPPDPPLKDRTYKELKAIAKDLGIAEYYKMSKATLIQAIHDA